MSACYVEKFSKHRKEGVIALFEHFKPTLLSYDEVFVVAYTEFCLVSFKIKLTINY